MKEKGSGDGKRERKKKSSEKVYRLSGLDTPERQEQQEPAGKKGGEQDPSDSPSKKDRSGRFKAGGLLLLGFLAVYIPSAFHWVYGGNITTDIIRTGIIEESTNVQCFVVRDEQVLETPSFSGKYMPEAAEGERVPVSGSVATVLEKSSLALLDELDRKNAQIVEAQNEKAKNTELYSADILKIQDDISQNIGDLAVECSNNSLTGARNIRESINRLIGKKAEIAGSGSKDSRIAALKKERGAIQNRIDASTKNIRSPYSGIISYIVDGCEQKLTPSTITAMTPRQLEALKPEKYYGNTDTATAGKPLVKVIKGGTMYLAAILEPQRAQALKAGKNLTVRVNDINTDFPAVFFFLSNAADGKCIFVVKMDRGLDELSSVRKVNVDFVSNKYEGLKVPLHSFINMAADGKSGTLAVVKANYATLRKVEIVGKNSEYAIIRSPGEGQDKSVGLYDSYVVDPRNIEEGQLVNQ